MKFCFKIGSLVENDRDVKHLLNLIRAQHSLPPSDLNEVSVCVALMHVLYC